jgi:hypothetical protein
MTTQTFECEGGTMQRRTVAAAVAAITMSLASGVIAFGANTGTLGLAGGQAASPAPVTAPAPTTPTPTAAQNTTARSSHDEETARPAANPSAERAAQGGEHDD